MDLIQTWYDDRYYCTLHFVSSLTELDLNSRSPELVNYLKKFSIGLNGLGILLGLAGAMNFITTLLYPFNIQGRIPLHSDMYRQKCELQNVVLFQYLAEKFCLDEASCYFSPCNEIYSCLTEGCTSEPVGMHDRDKTSNGVNRFSSRYR